MNTLSAAELALSLHIKRRMYCCGEREYTLVRGKATTKEH